ncbi:hypothetical protein BDR26DRAFT_916721 [Obelidium mucronatum]|nr:hypothetical protein BDR26DRAFT_916721 [Obelidium mucronatum]
MVDFVLFTAICFGAAVLGIIHLYYSPRLLAKFVSIVLGFALKRTVSVSLDSISISPLSGKLMFKGFKYKTCDLTVLILRGHITFRFWNLTRKPLSPMLIRLDGFELFIYNNAPAYEFLKSILEKEKQQKQPNDASPIAVESHPLEPRSSRDHFMTDSIRGNRTAAIDVKVKPPLPPSSLSHAEILLSRLFPFMVVGLKGAIIIGNSDITTMMVVDFKDLSGNYTRQVIAPAIPTIRPELCRYEMKIKLGFCRVSFRKNPDYRDPSLNQAARVRISKMQHESTKKRWVPGSAAARRESALEKAGLGTEPVDGGVEWIGLVRYNEDVDNVFGGKTAIEEYGKVEEVIMSDAVHVVYYSEDLGIEGVDSSLPAPKWGVDLILTKSKVTYGPWTNRQRLLIQNFFFPPSYRTSEPTEPPETGYHRQYPKFVLQFKFENGCAFEVPFREESKDPQFVEDSVNAEARRIQLSLRKPGWLNFNFNGPNSFLKFEIPMLSPSTGYSSVISMRMENLSVTTSLNDSELLKCQSFEIECLLESPLKWNGERVWKYNIGIENGKLHYLQDHIVLLQDLISDLSYSQTAPNPAYFVPIAYQIKVHFKKIETLLCTNRNNIIHIANDADENSFVSMKLDEATLQLELPFLLAKPVLYGMKFNLMATGGAMVILYPPSHSIGAFLTESSIGKFQNLKVSGSYEYYDVNAGIPEGPDAISLNIELDTSTIKAYGFTITSIFDFLSNYLGECSHIIRIDDYRLKLSDPLKFKAQRAKMQYDTQNANPIEVSLEIAATNIFAILPEMLYKCEWASIIQLDSVTFELASNMNEQILKATTSPMLWTRNKITAELSVESISSLFENSIKEPRNFLKVGGVEVVSRNLFGPAPKCLVYASDTIMHCQSITGEIGLNFFRGVSASVNCILHHLRDVDDSLPSKKYPTLNVFKLRIDPVKVSLWGPESVIVANFGRGIKLQFDSMVTKKWSDRTLIDVPTVDIKMLTAANDKPQNLETLEWIEVFHCETSLSACLLTFMDDIDAVLTSQRTFILAQDYTFRCAHLFDTGSRRANGVATGALFKVPSGFDFELDYDHESGSHNRTKTDGPDGYFSNKNAIKFINVIVSRFRKSVGNRIPRSTGASPFGSRSSSFLGSGFSLDAKYKTHLRTFKEVHQPNNQTADFVSFYGDFSPPKRKTRRPFPYQDIELLSSAEFTDSTPHSKIIIRASECFKLLVTPFGLKAIQQFLEISFDMDDLIGFSLLDALHVYYTSLIVQPLVSHTQYTTLIVSVPEMHIRSVQDVRFPEVPGKEALDDIGFRNGYSESSLCSVDIQTVNLLQIANAGFKSRAGVFSSLQRVTDAHYSLDLGLLKLSVRYLGSMVAGKNQRVVGIPLSKQLISTELPEIMSNHPVVLDSYCSDVKWLCDFEKGPSPGTPSNVAINTQSQSFELVFINETAEIVAGATAVWAAFANDLITIATKYMEQEQLQLQSFVLAVIQQPIAGGAKYFTSPSSLWLLGNGFRKFQNDIGWKFLSHIRYCMKELKDDQICALVKQRRGQKKANLIEVAPTIQKWLGMPDDRSDLNHILSLIFDTASGSSRNTIVDFIKLLSDYAPSVVFLIQRVKISAFEPGGSDNVFQLSPLLVDISSSTRSKSEIIGKKDTEIAQEGKFVDIATFISISKANIMFNPNIFRLMRHMIRVYNRVRDSSLLGSPNPVNTASETMDFGIIMSATVEELGLSASANNLNMRTVIKSVAANGIYYSKAASFDLPDTLQSSAILSVKKVLVDVLEVSTYGSNNLVTLHANDLGAMYSGAKSSLVGLELIEIRLPKSLLKLQAFFEQWGDSLPEYDLSFNKFLKELERSTSSLQELKKIPELQSSERSNVQFVVKNIVLVSDLLSTLRCRYSISNLMALLKRDSGTNKSDLSYAGRIGHHKVEFETRSNTHYHAAARIHVAPTQSIYLLPDANLEGTLTTIDSTTTLSSTLIVGTLEGSFDVHLIDQLLTLQSLLGSEVNDIVDMVMFYYRRRTDPLSSSDNLTTAIKYVYDIQIRIAGVEVTAESPQSKLLLSSNFATLQIQKASTESLNWNVFLGNCSLALISNTKTLAKIVVDVQLRNHSIQQHIRDAFSSEGTKEKNLETIFLQILKLNGVLHPFGVGKIADFMLYYSKELEERSRRKTLEMDIMKRNAQRLFSSVNAPTSRDSVEVKSFFVDKLVLVHLDKVGLAFPLTQDARMSHVPALLICFQDIQYESICLVENHGGISNISVQFVDRFNPQDDSTFLSASHPIQNRFLLRQIEGDIFQYFKEGFGSIKIDASIAGFDLNLNSTITEHLNSLISVYASERAQFDSSVSSTPFTSASPLNKSSTQHPNDSFTELAFDCDFVFGAGACKINCQESRTPSVESLHARKISNISGQNEENYDEQVFTIPGIGFKINGTTCLGDDSHAETRVQRGIYITQHIYESENILHPSVLSFFLKAASSINLDSLSASKASAPAPQSSAADSSISSLESQKHTVTYFLKLSQTKVSLSCLPESKVNLNFVLEEADVLFGFEPTDGDQRILNSMVLTCCVKGMNGSLRHTFSPEDCLRWSVSQLLINSTVLFNNNSRNFLINLDSASISAALNVRQLHDLLLFQRLWVIPLIPTKAQKNPSLDEPGNSVLASLLRLPGHGGEVKQSFKDSFHFTLRLPSVCLSADFGQSVGKTSITAIDLVASADVSWTGESFGAKSLTAALTSIKAVADGRFSGEVNVAKPQFYLLGSNDFSPVSGKAVTRGLFNIEKVEGQMQFQYERILIVDLKPLDYVMVDSWITHEGSLTLCTDVKLIVDSFKVVVSRRTIPAFYQLLDKLTSAMEEKMHLEFSPPGSPTLQRSSKFLSQVFLLPSNSEVSISPNELARQILWYKNGVKSLGRIHVELKSTLLNFMRYNFRDPDCARMISKSISFSLEHQGEGLDLLREALNIKLDGISIKKGTTRSLTPEEERMWSASEWFTFLGSSPSKNVATIPAIVITLNSLCHLLERRVELSGDTAFAAQIDIALNFGLYRFLQELFEFYQTAFKQDGEGLLPVATKEENARGRSMLTSKNSKPTMFVYKKGDFKFDPQLKVTGEATPRELIEWLGVNKTRIPELLYAHIGTALSDVVVWVARNS